MTDTTPERVYRCGNCGSVIVDLGAPSSDGTPRTHDGVRLDKAIKPRSGK